jgi:predicted DNA-binding protein
MTTKDTVIATRISHEDKEKLLLYAKELQRSPASIFTEQLEDFIETQEALRSESFQKRLEESRKSKTYSAEEVWKELGIE